MAVECDGGKLREWREVDGGMTECVVVAAAVGGGGAGGGEGDDEGHFLNLE